MKLNFAPRARFSRYAANCPAIPLLGHSEAWKQEWARWGAEAFPPAAAVIGPARRARAGAPAAPTHRHARPDACDGQARGVATAACARAATHAQSTPVQDDMAASPRKARRPRADIRSSFPPRTPPLHPPTPSAATAAPSAVLLRSRLSRRDGAAAGFRLGARAAPL